MVDECSSFGNPDTLQFNPIITGYEIYSRPVCNDWAFSILYVTSSLKTYDEVIGEPGKKRLIIKLLGKEDLKKALQKIPAPKYVSIISESWLEKIWGPGKYNDLQLPPDSILNELEQTAVTAGLTWWVVK